MTEKGYRHIWMEVLGKSPYNFHFMSQVKFVFFYLAWIY